MSAVLTAFWKTEKSQLMLKVEMEASTLSKSSNTDGNTKKANKKVLELFGLTVGPFFARFSQSWRAKSDITITCFAVGGVNVSSILGRSKVPDQL